MCVWQGVSPCATARCCPALPCLCSRTKREELRDALPKKDPHLAGAPIRFFFCTPSPLLDAPQTDPSGPRGYFPLCLASCHAKPQQARRAKRPWPGVWFQWIGCGYWLANWGTLLPPLKPHPTLFLHCRSQDFPSTTAPLRTPSGLHLQDEACLFGCFFAGNISG